MSIIDEIRRQRSIIGPGSAKYVILSSMAFEQLLTEKETLGLNQFNTEVIPPTIYGMTVEVVDEPNQEEVIVRGGR